MQHQLSNSEIAGLFRAGVTRKMEERERFVMLSANHPEKASEYESIIRYLGAESRYYDLAAHYYSQDVEVFASGNDEDLLMMIMTSELSPKLYGEYLRALDPESRKAEKITHIYITSLKKTMGLVRDGMR